MNDKNTQSSTSESSDNAGRNRLLERLIGAGILLLIAVIAIPFVLDGPHDNGNSSSTTPTANTESSNTHVDNGVTAPNRSGSPSGIQVIVLGDDNQHTIVAPQPEVQSEPVGTGDNASSNRQESSDQDLANNLPASDKPSAISNAQAANTDATLSTSNSERSTNENSPADDSTPVQNAAVTAPPADTASRDWPAGSWQVQLGSFSNQGYAQELRARAVKLGHDAFVMNIEVNDKTYYRVRVKPSTTKAAAQIHASELSSQLSVSATAVPE